MEGAYGFQMFCQPTLLLFANLLIEFRPRTPKSVDLPTFFAGHIEVMNHVAMRHR